MAPRFREIWLPRFLFLVTLGCALALTGGVLVSPYFDPKQYPSAERWIVLFAEDTTVRRTALASSLGLAVTAFVFFKPGLLLRRKPNHSKPPPPVIGA